MRNAAITTLILLLLTACAALTPPKSLDQRIAFAYGVHTAVQSAAASSLDAHEITSKEAEQVLALADKSRQILDGAKLAAGVGDLKSAEGQLQLATTVLLQLQAHLRGQS